MRSADRPHTVRTSGTSQPSHFSHEALALCVQTVDDGGRQSNEARPIPFLSRRGLLYRIVHQPRQGMRGQGRGTRRSGGRGDVRVGTIRDFHHAIEPLLGLRSGQIDRHGELVDRFVQLYPRILGAKFLAFICDHRTDVVGQYRTGRFVR